MRNCHAESGFWHQANQKENVSSFQERLLSQLDERKLILLSVTDAGLTELNTFFMIARRCWQSQRVLMHRLYWLTYVPLR